MANWLHMPERLLSYNLLVAQNTTGPSTRPKDSSLTIFFKIWRFILMFTVCCIPFLVTRVSIYPFSMFPTPNFFAHKMTWCSNCNFCEIDPSLPFSIHVAISFKSSKVLSAYSLWHRRWTITESDIPQDSVDWRYLWNKPSPVLSRLLRGCS